MFLSLCVVSIKYDLSLSINYVKKTIQVNGPTTEALLLISIIKTNKFLYNYVYIVKKDS